MTNALDLGKVGLISNAVYNSITSNTTAITAISVGAANAANLTTSTNVATIGTAAYFVANGNVGIGNSAPDAKLAVTGTANVSGNVVFGAGISVNGSFGTAGQALTSNGAGAYWAAVSSGGGFTSIQVFTSSGTWTKPAGINKIFIRGVGGGGAGGGVRNSVAATGSGGGAGGYFEKFLDVSTISTANVTIGSGGTGVSSAGGNAGGATSFGIYASGNGGAGGLLEYGGGGNGGTATGGNINITGQSGSVGGGSSNIPGGLGGSNLLGIGGGMLQPSTYGTGNNGRGYGSGGGGGATNSGGGGISASAGGDGAAGIVIVLEYT